MRQRPGKFDVRRPTTQPNPRHILHTTNSPPTHPTHNEQDHAQAMHRFLLRQGRLEAVRLRPRAPSLFLLPPRAPAVTTPQQRRGIILERKGSQGVLYGNNSSNNQRQRTSLSPYEILSTKLGRFDRYVLG